MKNISLKVISLAAMAVILVFATAQSSASGQGKGRRIQGTWRTSGTVINCQTGATVVPFLGLNTFMDGGSMFATGASNPALSSIGYGVWEYAGGRSFTNTIVSFRFNSDGSFAGTQKVTRLVELDATGEHFTSTNSLEIADATGNVIATRCSTETGQRVE